MAMSWERIPVYQNPSKSEELETWRAFVANLPNESYLAMYLAGSDEILEHEMRNDASCDLIATIRTRRDDALESLREVTKAETEARNRRDDLRREVEDMEGRLRRVWSAFKDLELEAAKVERAAMEGLNRVSQV